MAGPWNPGVGLTISRSLAVTACLCWEGSPGVGSVDALGRGWWGRQVPQGLLPDYASPGGLWAQRGRSSGSGPESWERSLPPEDPGEPWRRARSLVFLSLMLPGTQACPTLRP